MGFSDLGLSDKVQSAVAATGYTEPTPIQAEAIPHVLARRDVLGLAQTGTGKTASFVLPMLSMLEKGRARARMPRTLILEPTRELAAQVEESFNRYGVNHKLTVSLLIGGVSFADQARKIDRGADVVIATPGRLLDHLERGKLLLQGIEVFVIDEADRMLDMGFIPDVERIFKILPVTRQTLFFSATMPKEIQSLVQRFLPNAERVEVSSPTSTAATVTQSLVRSGSTAAEKRARLRDEIAGAEGLKNAIIFCNRKRDVGIVDRSLQRHGLSAGALHGDMDQRSRMATLDAFKRGEIKLLIASDVAARGLDIPDVSHVFNYDVPHHSEDYIHRIGRTGRAGRSGTAIMIVTSDDTKSLTAIEKMLGRKLDWADGARGAATSSSGEAPSRSGDAADTGGKRRRRSGGRGARQAAETGAAQSPEPVESAPVARGESSAAETRQPSHARSSGDTAGSPDRQSESRGSSRRKGEDRRRDSRGSGRDSHGSERDVAFGETSYVPAFLLRPVRLKPLEELTDGAADSADEATVASDKSAASGEPAGGAASKVTGRKSTGRSGRRSSGRRSKTDAAAPETEPATDADAAGADAPELVA